MKQRDETLTSVERSRQFTDQNVAKLRQLVQKTRMDAHTTSFLTPREEADVRNTGHQREEADVRNTGHQREEADVRNTGHQREASRRVEQHYANKLHTHIKELIKQDKSDNEIEAAVQDFRATYLHPINSSYCQAEASSQYGQGDQAGTSSQAQEISENEKDNIKNAIKHIRSDYLETWPIPRIKTHMDEKGINTPEKATFALSHLATLNFKYNPARHNNMKSVLKSIRDKKPL